MTSPTYGNLMSDAENHVLAAVSVLSRGTPGPASTRAAIRGHGRLLQVAAKHADFLLQHGATYVTGGGRDLRRAVADFRQALTPWRRPAVHLEANEPAVHEAWKVAAINLGLAHDVLASHIGPSGEPLTLHAPFLDDLTANSGALLRLAAIIDVATLAAPRLAREARRGETDSSPELAMVEQHTLPLWASAAQLTGVIAEYPWTTRLDRLRPVPRLQLPTADRNNPLGIVNAAIDVAGRLTIEQVHQPGPHSVATVHLLNATIVALLGHAELLAQSVTNSAAPTELAHSLGRARTAWYQAARAVAAYPSLAPAPELLTKAALMARRTMAELTRADGRWKRPAEIADTLALASSSASPLDDTLDRLALLSQPVAELARHCAASGLLATRHRGLPGLVDRRLLPDRRYLDAQAAQGFAHAISAIRVLPTTRPPTTQALEATPQQRRTLTSAISDRRVLNRQRPATCPPTPRLPA